ncbi:uncharacterized protein LOC141525620 [Cotesia typhae]|uniref:uncharacterized protein LOC141525620 n=1 Tax=Cotesia typhae TaxID=2053667 RepID=UPI003D6946DE
MSVVNKHASNFQKLNQLMKLTSKLSKDFIEFHDRVNVFFKNYLSILMSNEEKRFDLYIEFSRLDLLCKKLNKFIDGCRDLIDQKSNEVSKVIAMLSLNSPLEKYNAIIDYLNQQIKDFDNLKNDLLGIQNKPLAYVFNNENFTLDIIVIIKYFKSVVGPSRMGNRDNSNVLMRYLDDIVKMFRSYVEFPLEECEKITNPCPRVVNEYMRIEDCPFVTNANQDDSGLEKDGKTVYVKNTCGFGSVVHIFLASIIDDPCYELKLWKNQSREVKLLFQLKANPENSLGLVKRYLVDTPGLELTKKDGKDILDLKTDIVAIWDACFPSINSGVFSCPHSQNGGFKHRLIIAYDHKVDLLNTSTTDNVARKLMEFKDNFVISNNCDANCAGYLQLEDQLFIDIAFNKPLRFTIDYFETELNYENQKFRLAGVIENVQEPSKHFLAYVRRINGDWQVYNDSFGTMSGFADLSLHICPVAVIYVRE